jgi:hypothetical protein
MEYEGAHHLLFVSVSGYSPALQMSSTAAEWLKLNDDSTVTFIAYPKNRALVESRHPRIKFVPLEGNDIITDEERYEFSVRAAQDGVSSLGYLFELFYEHYDNDIAVLNQTVLEKKPDFVVIDFFATSAFDFFAFHKIPYVSFYHCFSLGILGIEDNPALPDVLLGDGLEDRSFLGRLRKVGSFVKIVMATSKSGRVLNGYRRKYGYPEYLAPDVNLLGRPMIVMTSFALDYPRKISPLVRVVGLYIDHSEKSNCANVPDDHQVLKWLAKKKDSLVVYCAFGTEQHPSVRQYQAIINGVTRSKPLLLAIRTSVLERLQITKEMLSQGHSPDQLLIVDWVTQSMVLKQPQVAISITHGGAASIGDSIYGLKPMIIIPEGADRAANAARMVDQGVARRLDAKTFTMDDVAVACESICSSESVMRQKLKWMIQVNEHAGGGAPGAAREIDMLVTDGYAHLVPREVEMGWFAYTGLDLILFFLLISSPVIYFVYQVIRRVFSLYA